MKLFTLETVRAELRATNAMLASYAAESRAVPIGVELFCINLARCVYQLCAPTHDLSWLVLLPANTLPAMMFMVQESARQLDACGPSAAGFPPPRVRPALWRRTPAPTAETSAYVGLSTAST